LPTVLLKKGWRFFFFSNEGNEPIHIHVVKGEKSCKYFLDESNIEIKMAFQRNMKVRDIREVKEIIFENFNYIIEQWKEFQKEK